MDRSKAKRPMKALAKVEVFDVDGGRYDSSTFTPRVKVADVNDAGQQSMTKVNTVVQLDDRVHAHYSGAWGWCIRRKSRAGRVYWLCGVNAAYWADLKALDWHAGKSTGVRRRTYESLQELQEDYAVIKLAGPIITIYSPFGIST